MRRRAIISTTIFALICGFAFPGRATDRNSLWQVISTLCVRGQNSGVVPFPCAYVDAEKGFAILGAGGAHFLLVPTVRIRGIESPALIAPVSPNYWEYAWEARSRLDQSTGAQLSRDEVGLAVNSAQA